MSDRRQREARVRAVLAAARRLADPDDALGQRLRADLRQTTGLSREGVELGLTKHLETSVSARDLDVLLERAGEAQRVWAMLPANVFVAALRAVALAVAASDTVLVRPSRRELALAAALCEALAGERLFEIVAAISPAPGDALHFYGGDEAFASVRAKLPAGVRVFAHTSGFGVAVVESADAFEHAADALSWDVVAFDQRGCLSPRIVFVAGTAEARIFAAALSTSLERRAAEVPRGALGADEKTQARLYAETLGTVGAVFGSSSSMVGVDAAPSALILPPPGRHVHVVGVTVASQLVSLLAPWRHAITAIGHTAAIGPLVEAARELAPFARTAALGAMQTPPLDGPVDLRVVCATT